MYSVHVCNIVYWTLFTVSMTISHRMIVCRWPFTEDHSPMTIVVDSQSSLPAASKDFLIETFQDLLVVSTIKLTGKPILLIFDKPVVSSGLFKRLSLRLGIIRHCSLQSSTRNPATGTILHTQSTRWQQTSHSKRLTVGNQPFSLSLSFRFEWHLINSGQDCQSLSNPAHPCSITDWFIFSYD